MFAILTSLLLGIGAQTQQSVPAASIATAVEARLHEELRKIGSGARLTLHATRDQSVPAGSLEIRVGVPAGRLPRRHVVVPATLNVDGVPVRTVPVQVDMHDPRNVLVYAADHAKGMPGQELQPDTGEVDMTCCAGAPLLDPREIAGSRLRRSVKRGQPVLVSDFEPVPEIRSREPIVVELSRGSVVLAAKGVAMADGRLGDRVLVRTASSQQTFQAKVTGPNTVRVDE